MCVFLFEKVLAICTQQADLGKDRLGDWYGRTSSTEKGRLRELAGCMDDEKEAWFISSSCKRTDGRTEFCRAHAASRHQGQAAVAAGRCSVKLIQSRQENNLILCLSLTDLGYVRLTC